MPSVIEAPIKSADASNSFSPFGLVSRPVERIQIKSGMLKIRTNVMELGKFTGDNQRQGNRKTAMADYPPRRKGKAMDGRAGSGATSKRAASPAKSLESLREMAAKNSNSTRYGIHKRAAGDRWSAPAQRPAYLRTSAEIRQVQTFRPRRARRSSLSMYTCLQ